MINKYEIISTLFDRSRDQNYQVLLANLQTIIIIII